VTDKLRLEQVLTEKEGFEEPDLSFYEKKRMEGASHHFETEEEGKKERKN